MKSRLGPWLVFLFLAGFPLFLISRAVGYLADLRQETSRETQFQHQDQLLTRIQPYADPETYLRRALRQLVQKARRRPDPLAWLLRQERFLGKTYPGLFSFTLFNASGTVVFQTERGPLKLPQRLREKMLQAFTPLPNGFLPEHSFEGSENLFGHYIGNEQAVKSLDSGFGWVPASTGLKKTWFFFYLDRRFTLFVHIHRAGVQPMQGLHRFLRRSRVEQAGLFLLDATTGEVEGPDAGRWKNEVWAVSSRYEREARTHFAGGGRLWSVLLLDPSFRLICSSPDRSAQKAAAITTSFHLGMILYLFLSIAAFLVFQRHRDSIYLPIRMKFLSLFLFAVGIPLTILIFVGAAYQEERLQSRLQAARRDAGDILRNFDHNLPIIGKVFQRRLHEILGVSRHFTPASLALYQPGLQRFYTRFRCRYVKIFDRQGNEIFSLPDAERHKEKNRFYRGLMAQMLNVFNPEDVVPLDAKAAQADAMLDSLSGGRGGRIIDSLVRHVGEVSLLELGSNKAYLLPMLLPSPNGRPEHLILAGWEKKDLVMNYLKQLLSTQPDENGNEMFGISLYSQEIRSPNRLQTSSLMPRVKTTFTVVPEKPVTPKMMAFFRSLRRVNRFDSAFVTYKDRPYLMSGTPGAELENHLLFLLRPLEAIYQDILLLRRQFLGFGVLCLAFTLLLGTLLAKSFLQPIQHLTGGVMAVRAKRFSHRIPPQARDELGDLSVIFNQMIEGLHEVSLGKQVQEQLFPREALEGGDFVVAGFSRAATQLGGDYFDFLKVGENRLLVLVGDVTGHGVPAALVMAIAKATVVSRASQAQSLTDYLNALNQVIFGTMKKKLNMTCVALWINLETGDCEFINCGHPYPVFQNADGGVRNIESSGIGLGLRLKLPLSPLQLRFEPGERLFLYTDGLAETLGDEKTDGFDMLMRYFQGRPRLSPQEACRDAVLNHPHILTSPVQADDFTLVIVERKTAPPAGQGGKQPRPGTE